MEPSLLPEYRKVQEEVVESRTCITEYMKMFIAVGVGMVGLFAILARGSLLDGDASTPAHASQEEWAYLPLILAELVLWFAAILFHKFNTHNRACGYMRVLEMERHNKDPSKDEKPENQEYWLWQATLALPYQTKGFHWGVIESEEHFVTLRNTIINRLDGFDPNIFSFRFIKFFRSQKRVRLLIVKIWRYLRRCIFGLKDIVVAPVFRASTQSWTYPFQVGFGPLMLTLFLIVAWAIPAWESGIGVHTLLQTALVMQLVISWCGLGYRMYRLTDDKGDRTIQAWCWKMIYSRYKALKCRDIQASYVGWMPGHVSRRLNDVN